MQSLPITVQFFKLFKSALKTADRTTVSDTIRPLFKLFLELFDLRGSVPESEANEVSLVRFEATTPLPIADP